MLIVVTGKTASGKDTITDILLQKYPTFKKVITSTSRLPRNGEINGVNHHFISREDFLGKVSNNEFVEHIEYAGNLYGTEKKEFNQAENTIWRIDPSAAGRVREFLKQELLVIFITTTDEVILDRLRERGLSEEEINKRMSQEKIIWEQYKDSYNYVIENQPGKLDETVDLVCKIINEKL